VNFITSFGRFKKVMMETPRHIFVTSFVRFAQVTDWLPEGASLRPILFGYKMFSKKNVLR
jgi:hypothetical protein